ncbi:MazG nucleotide pyrophosphohydrolase domain-containing protein [Leptospira interrogans]|uniref:NTP pyrophosphohydrolase MazG-like domain-containing protein n=3 Tax=Leptospira interrogans TaxID=173 RepID=A0AAP9WIS6_LEPIR|nr:MazG nucleotide pyrophosphohydrolase domain-containing protein [Leptospira interrogans]EJP18146.1 MazG nucleotide pyrophosphohydrolase domain protein [Leptospira interrogans str. FPW2026]EMN82508.1 MazG nucleotide pyrophosphohydrolase domain protein [Leptospira interrogans serovar Grippotyphosa str. UI 12764]KAK2617157.1 MazG nucleotide pyrophosphohydrolase domain-containing protein [Leptospira interrogans]QOI45239.1 hypothetical protein Lepto782_24015 [Leptospira interrogans serovar Canicol
MKVYLEAEKIASQLDEIQDFSLQVYGKYDLEKSLLWMTEELGEVISAIRKKRSFDEIEEEIGDLIAWVFNIANIQGLRISRCYQKTLIKEINRQIKKYGKLKYLEMDRSLR